MEKETLKQIIIENQEFINSLELFPRDLSFEEGANYVLTGPRRAGKTFAMFLYIKQILQKGKKLSEILYVNFEDERLMELNSEHLNLLLEAYYELFDHRPILFFDEIQNIAGWEKFARRLADARYQVFVTGSNAKMLSSEMASTLGGRFLIMEIYPLSFKEYIQACGIVLNKNWPYSEQRFQVRKLFDDYFIYGGFPETIRFSDKRLWLRNLYNKIFFGDILTRYKIRNDFALRLMVKKLAESTHDEISFNRIRHIVQSSGIKIGTATIIEYVNYLEDSWLAFRIGNMLAKTSQRESAGKFYFIDNGILSLFLMNAETILLENIVAVHLRRKYHDEVYYLKRNNEVDFYIPSQKTMVQVAYAIRKAATQHREINAIMAMARHVDTNQMLVLTLDTEKELTLENHLIRFMPVWKWLLHEA